jgi:integrase
MLPIPLLSDFKSVVSTIPPPRQIWKINGLGNALCSHNAFWDTVGTLDLPFRVLLVSLKPWRDTPMATIERRKDTYRVKVRRKGAPPLTATFTHLAQAKKWAQMTESAVLEGRHFTVTEAKRHTLADLIDRYICEVLPHKRASTVPDQARQLNWWKTQLGHSLLAEVTPAIIVRYRNTLTHGRANGTVNRYLAVLSHAFTVAVKEWQWCADNPVRKVSKPKEPRGRVRFLADDERERLLAACQTSRNKHLYAITVLALATGARRGELLNLRWSDVDVKRGTLTFHQTKNGERRAVPLTGYALDVLTQHTKGRRLDTPLVFPDSTGTRPVGVREAFEWAIKQADIANFKFHDLRHTFASYLAMNGATCCGQGKTDTEFNNPSTFLICIGTDIPEIRVLPSAVVEHLDVVDHIISRFLACGIVTQRRALAF